MTSVWGRLGPRSIPPSPPGMAPSDMAENQRGAPQDPLSRGCGGRTGGGEPGRAYWYASPARYSIHVYVHWWGLKMLGWLNIL